MSRKKAPNKKAHSYSPLLFIIITLAVALVLYTLYVRSHPTHSSTSTNQKSSLRQPLTSYAGVEIPVLLTPRQEQIIEHIGYTVSYNSNWLLPNWVAYELTPSETRGTEKRSNRFVADPFVKEGGANNDDYARSGYDKGHMAAAADMRWSSEVMKESFYFSNICPQHPELNRRRWKELEEKSRRWAMADSAIVIVCGPIVASNYQRMGKNQLAIPTKFFKVILAPYASPPRAIGFIFENDRAVEPLRRYAVTVDSVESVTKMDFFSALPDRLENAIEAYTDTFKWDI